jgi:membrane associated rhomboid family serine protease
MKIYAVIALIAANVAVFVLQSQSSDTMEVLFALWPLQSVDGPSNFHLWQIVTYSFLHSTENVSHLLLNMFGLWVFGTWIERSLGPWRLLACYFASVITAALTQLFLPMVFGEPPEIAIGASGGVFGLLLACAVMFPKTKVALYFLIPMPIWLFATLFAGIELFQGVAGIEPGVGHFGHLGGMVGSALAITLWRARRRVR